MDAPIVLSHKTAWLYYQASGVGALSEDRNLPALAPTQRTPRSFAKSIRKTLTACGVDEDRLDKLDILISFPEERTQSAASLLIPMAQSFQQPSSSQSHPDSWLSIRLCAFFKAPHG